MAEEMNGRWVTAKGRRVFIQDGETVQDAMDRHTKNKEDLDTLIGDVKALTGNGDFEPKNIKSIYEMYSSKLGKSKIHLIDRNTGMYLMPLDNIASWERYSNNYSSAIFDIELIGDSLYFTV